MTRAKKILTVVLLISGLMTGCYAKGEWYKEFPYCAGYWYKLPVKLTNEVIDTAWYCVRNKR